MEKFIVNGKTYLKIKLLGHGKGGYSYLVEDEERNRYTLKKIHHEPCSYYQFGNKIECEINDYQRLLNTGINIPKMIDVDKENEIIIKEFIDGSRIDELVLNDQMDEKYLNQVKEMCKILYSLDLNIDYYPTNFIVQDEKLYYIDYECNKYSEEWDFEHWGIKFWSKTEDFLKNFR